MKAALVGCGKAGQSLLEELVANNNVSKIEVFDPDITKVSNLYKTRDKVILFSESLLMTKAHRPKIAMLV